MPIIPRSFTGEVCSGQVAGIFTVNIIIKQKGRERVFPL